MQTVRHDITAGIGHLGWSDIEAVGSRWPEGKKTFLETTLIGASIFAPAIVAAYRHLLYKTVSHPLRVNA
ncbi:MAG: hypothetical protein ACJ8AI_09790 [Rhodopila sp.]